MADVPSIEVPPGDRLLAVARVDREIRFLRLGLATVLSLMMVVALSALFGATDGMLGLMLAMIGAATTFVIDAVSFRKVYALTDRHVVILSREGTERIPYAKIGKVRRWITSLNLTIGTKVTTLEDLRDVDGWEQILRERVDAWDR
ncbi:MAG: hypothetical protein AAF646_02175 [Pseudomonadota bacterium]